MIKKASTTIKDLARQLNISPSTVSRALKNHPDISEETRSSVVHLAEKLEYRPNAVAISLKQRRTNTLGIIIPEIIPYFFSSVISGIEDIAYEAGYNVIICQSNEMFARERENVRTLLASQVDGILASVSRETADFSHFEQVRKDGVPLVFFDRIAPDILADQVTIDDYEAAYQAVDHLIRRGRKKIVHLAGPSNLLIAQKRKEGYKKALTDAGIHLHESLIYEADSFEKAENTIRQIIRTQTQIDAIFAVNDNTAIGAMKTLQKNGLRIPEDVAVIGFSDSRLAVISNPTLTSVDQHGYDMGTIATEMLLRRVLSEEAYPCEQRVLKARLIVRDSTGIEKMTLTHPKQVN